MDVDSSEDSCMDVLRILNWDISGLDNVLYVVGGGGHCVVIV